MFGLHVHEGISGVSLEGVSSRAKQCAKGLLQATEGGTMLP